MIKARGINSPGWDAVVERTPGDVPGGTSGASGMRGGGCWFTCDRLAIRRSIHTSCSGVNSVALGGGRSAVEVVGGSMAVVRPRHERTSVVSEEL